MKIAILDGATLGDDLSLAPIDELGSCRVYQNTAPAEVAERIQDVHVIISNKIKLTRDVLVGAKALKLICAAATGFDNIDVAYCKERGIAVCNVVGYSSHSVAQLTVATVLSLSVHLQAYCAYVESGAYSASGIANKLTPVYHELHGKTWGLVGYGNIAKEVAAVAEALGCRILVHKKTPVADCECVSMDELCQRADIITVHTPLNEGTRGLISRERLAMMKPDAILVNTARGAVVDEEAVSEAVLCGKLGAFGSDVYSVEPFLEGHPFHKIKNLPNVCLTPHMAWGSYESRNRCISEIAANIRAFERGEKRNRVDL
ncbi:MAG: hydroxyacid dehydrogenase [Ruminococcaceae bacterium]|nr:hydroxyacid dehydrogenase [Oscillospiraceae bacterium]